MFFLASQSVCNTLPVLMFKLVDALKYFDWIVVEKI